MKVTIQYQPLPQATNVQDDEQLAPSESHAYRRSIQTVREIVHLYANCFQLVTQAICHLGG